MKSITATIQYLVLILLFCIPGVAVAYEVSPMRVQIEPGTGSATTLININNTRSTALPVEVNILERTVTEGGQESYTPADEDFIVFPPQALVAPGTAQGIRVQYIGEPNLAVSKAYIISVAEVPVTPEGFTGVQIAVNFGVSLLVNAEGAEAKLMMNKVERTETGLKLSVSNSGNGYSVINGRELIVETSTNKIVLNKDQLSNVEGSPVIPPLSTRTFELKLDNIPSDGDITATFRD